MKKQEYIKIGKLNKNLFKKIGIQLITNEVVFTHERINHVEFKRRNLLNEVKKTLKESIYDPNYIYKDWNNRLNTVVLIKKINNELNLNIVLKIAVNNDEKHTKNSIITMLKIGEKTLNKIKRNKHENLLYEKIDKCE